MQLNGWKRALIAAGTLAVIVYPAFADDERATMLLIDGSGSMWGRLDADPRAKIDIVRDIAGAKLTSVTGGKAGFASFGHRRKGDCSDADVIAAPQTAREPVLGPLSKLNPKGKGPLALALRTTAPVLGQSRPASIIVIGDGADNCQQDACAAAAEIAKAQPGLAVHVISLAAEAGDIPQLACIAKATAGTFANVTSVAELKTAVDAAAALALLAPEAPPKPADTALPAAPVTQGLVRATAALGSGGPSITLPLRWRIFAKDNPSAVAEATGVDIEAKLEPGTYEAEVTATGVSARKSFAAEAGRALPVVVPLAAARLTIKTTGSKPSGPGAAAPLLTVQGSSEANGATVIAAEGSLLDTVLVPGAYAVTVSNGGVRQTRQISLALGEQKTLDIPFELGHLEVSASAKDNGEPLSDVTFIVAEDDPESPDGRREIARSGAPSSQFALAPGTYYVTARSAQSEVRQRIAIGAGEDLKRVLVLPLSPVKISVLIAGEPATAAQTFVYQISDLGGQRPAMRRAGREVEALLTPGKYRVEVSLPGQNITGAQDFSVEAGRPLAMAVRIDAAEVVLKAPGLAQTGSYFEIADERGVAVWRATGAEPKAYLPPGRYTARRDGREGLIEAAFAVKSGERRAVEFGPKLEVPKP